MFPLLSSFEAATLEKSLIESSSLSERSLIDNVAVLVYTKYRFLFDKKRVLFVVGKGNNGSDALSLALHVSRIAKAVYIYCHWDKGNSENEYRKSQIPSSFFVSEVRTDVDTIVDGLFGSGYREKIDERTERVIESINTSSAVVLSLDSPSCYRVKADYTITFMCYKKEMYNPSLRLFSGEVTLSNPGFPQNKIRSIEKRYLLSSCDYSIPQFKATDYKNSRGSVTVVGGSDRYPGAPILTSLAAFHSGAGRVTIISTAKVHLLVFSSYPSIMVSSPRCPLPMSDCYVVGPGWNRGSRNRLEEVINSGKKIVVDADGIKHLSGLSLKNRGVITPHIGEYRRLIKMLGIEEDTIEESLKKTALRLECVVVLKGSVTIVTDGDAFYYYDGVNPSVAVAGSGDVLAGIIGAFLAFGMDALQSALNAVILHQKCGRFLEKNLGFYSAEDIIKTIGRMR